MCIQCEREDVIQIYLSRKRDFGILSSEDHEALIQQAGICIFLIFKIYLKVRYVHVCLCPSSFVDNPLKRAKGKGMLPAIKREDVIEMFNHLPRNEDGLLSFHDIQREVYAFRENRIKEFKLVFPSIGIKPEPFNFEPGTLGVSSRTNGVRPKRIARVSTCVAPATMFQHMKGCTNSDVIDDTNRFLKRFASKITDIDSGCGPDITCNVRLLRDVEPKIPEPKRKGLKIPPWSDTCTMKGTGLGSLVKTTPSSSTWKRTTTIY